ncbi:MAG: hypothetical protein MPK09_05950 [Gammaproteobacteria bacterium]|nr:hypothetical protein [Gammaproteobacteria bacterium]
MSAALVVFLLIGDLAVMALMIALLLWVLLRRGAAHSPARAADIPLHDEAGDD